MLTYFLNSSSLRIVIVFYQRKSYSYCGRWSTDSKGGGEGVEKERGKTYGSVLNENLKLRS